MTAYVGKKALASLWILVAFSVLATILWIIDAARSKKNSTNGTMVPKIIRRATGGLLGGNRRYENTSYDTLRPASREPSRGPSRDNSQEELKGKIIHRRSASQDPPRASEDASSSVLHDADTLLDEKRASQSRYEPFRHRDLP
jgi:hypothetical protein